MEADARGANAGGRSGWDELLRDGDEGRRRNGEDELELPDGAGSAGAFECGAAVSVSGGSAGCEAGDNSVDTECSGSAGSGKPVAAVSVSGGLVFVQFVFEFRRCEAGTAGGIERCGQLGKLEQLEFVGVFELELG